MPMDEPLGARYKALFRSYGVGGNGQVIRLKGHIAERAERLREDAMYFLLVNMDHMVIRALSGYIPATADDGLIGRPMDRIREPEEVDKMAVMALEVIENELAQSRPAQGRSSANDVVRAIQATADKISEIILWWKE